MMRFMEIVHLLPIKNFIFLISNYLLPISSFAVNQKDQKTLERLREERQAKINELKEITNYHTTQQLIQVFEILFNTDILCCHYLFYDFSFTKTNTAIQYLVIYYLMRASHALM